MTTLQTPDMQAVLERLENLERQNRRLKRVALVAVILLGTLFLTAQTQWRPNVLRANSFVLRDSDGRIRAKLTFCADSPCLSFLDQQGKETMKLAETLFQMGDGTDRQGLVQIGAGAVGPPIDTNTSPEEMRKAIQAGASFTKPMASIYLGAGTQKSRLSLTAEGSEAEMIVHDANGFQTIIGNTDLVIERTGESHKTSAASAVMFGKDEKVIWQAP